MASLPNLCLNCFWGVASKMSTITYWYNVFIAALFLPNSFVPAP